MKLKIILCSVAFALSACGGGGGLADNCDDKMDDTIKDAGRNPEEIDKFDSDDYHNWTFWYWKNGFSRSFEWGKNVDGCKTSDYRFAPIN